MYGLMGADTHTPTLPAQFTPGLSLTVNASHSKEQVSVIIATTGMKEFGGAFGLGGLWWGANCSKQDCQHKSPQATV